MMIKSNVPNPMYISAPLLSFFACLFGAISQW